MKEKKRLQLDLRELEHIEVAALLKLHAEITALQHQTNIKKPIAYRAPKDRYLRTLFEQFCFLREQENPTAFPGLISITSGTTGNQFRPPLFDNMNRAFYDGELQKEGEEWATLQGAIGEAILNVIDHAYNAPERADFRKSLGTRWWLVAQTIDNQLFIAIYDKGVGIPKTIFGSEKNKKTLQVLSRYFNIVKMRAAGADSAAIRTAMAYGRSRLNSNHSGHGTGLSEVRDLVANNPIGQLSILSNRGLYEYTSKGVETTREFRDSVHGTLIQWNISLR